MGTVATLLLSGHINRGRDLFSDDSYLCQELGSGPCSNCLYFDVRHAYLLPSQLDVLKRKGTL